MTKEIEEVQEDAHSLDEISEIEDMQEGLLLKAREEASAKIARQREQAVKRIEKEQRETVKCCLRKLEHLKKDLLAKEEIKKSAQKKQIRALMDHAWERREKIAAELVEEVLTL